MGPIPIIPWVTRDNGSHFALFGGIVLKAQIPKDAIEFS
jgi:hypothetical protein